MHTAAPAPAAPEPVVLHQATVKALCGAGYITSAEYLDLAATFGWSDDAFAETRRRRADPVIPARDSGLGSSFDSAEIDA